MVTDKMADFVVKLAEKTRQGKVDWSVWPSDQTEETFEACLRQLLVRISREDSMQYPGEYDYCLRLLDGPDNVLDVVTDSDLREAGLENGYRIMDGLFRMARARAAGTDQVIDEALSSLDEL